MLLVALKAIATLIIDSNEVDRRRVPSGYPISGFFELHIPAK